MTVPDNKQTPAPKGVHRRPKKSSLRYIRPPRGPRKPWVLYCMEERPKLKMNRPDAKFGEITRLLSKQWNDLDSAQSQRFFNAAEEDFNRYREEMAVFIKKFQQNEKKRHRKPKRKGPYIMFTRENYHDMALKHPGKLCPFIGKALGQVWKNMTPEEKDVYAKMSDAQYAIDLKEFEARMATEASTTSASTCSEQT